jgi:hypothetical protein
MERYEDHTIAHAIQAKYEKTKVNTSGHQTSPLLQCLLYDELLSLCLCHLTQDLPLARTDEKRDVRCW